MTKLIATASRLVSSVNSADEIREIADRLLHKAGVAGVLPTPMPVLINAADIREHLDLDEAKERFLATVSEQVRNKVKSIWQKLRGIADLRQKVIYTGNTTSAPRKLFADGHELGHQILPWHNVTGFIDTDKSLSPETRELFDREANLFAAETIFQGERFATHVRDYQVAFDSVFHLADLHGASRHSTLWRYTTVQDEAVAAIAYWPSTYSIDPAGNPMLRVGAVVGSPKFEKRYASVEIPEQLKSDHPWATARDSGLVQSGDVVLACDGSPTSFQWEAWWNTYTLFVLLRRRPKLGLVGRMIGGAKTTG